MATLSVIVDIYNWSMEFNMDHYFPKLLHISYSHYIIPIPSYYVLFRCKVFSTCT